MAERDVPFWVTVVEPVVEDITTQLADLDLMKAGEQPGMAMASLDEIPPPDSVVEITEVADPEGRDEFSTVTASAFEMPPSFAKQIDQAGLTADDVRLFLGSVDGHPAASRVLIQSGDVAGVYSIGVIEKFRRRGIGEAMSWAVLRAGRAAGCQVGYCNRPRWPIPSTRRWDSRRSSPITSSNQPPKRDVERLSGSLTSFLFNTRADSNLYMQHAISD